MAQRLNRIQPGLGAHLMQTYSIASPVQTHTRAASCAEADCPNHRSGWRTIVDETTDLGRAQASYIRRTSVRDGTGVSAVNLGGRRRYTEQLAPDGVTVFEFPPGQECFTAHRVPLDRPELYVVRGGDWRGNPTGAVRRHTRPAHWVEDMAENLDSLQTRSERG